MTDVEIDALFYTARTAEKLNYKDHSITFLNTIISKKPILNETILKFYIQVYMLIFEEYDIDIKKVQKIIDDMKVGTKLYQMRGLQQIRSNLQKKLISYHDEFTDKIKNTLISNNDDPVCQYLLFKSIGDSYKLVGIHIKGDILKQKIQDALESYENAVKISETEFGPTDPRYLRAILNMTAFQYAFMKIRDKPTNALFKCYNQGIALLDKVSSDKIQEFTAVLELMKRNMASWTSKEEEKTEQNLNDNNDKKKNK